MSDQRMNVFFVHPSRGKHMVTGPKTKEKLGYIAYGSFIENVHETDIAARSGDFICGTCQKKFTVSGDRAWCVTCYPPTEPVKPRLGQLKPRSADQRLKATEAFAQEKWQTPHKNFSQPPTVPQRPTMAPQPVPVQETQPVGPSDPKQVVKAAQAAKAEAFGIPVIEPNVIGPPPNLGAPTPTQLPQIPAPVPVDTHASVKDAVISDLDFGRSVNNQHKKLLADSGVVTLYDAMKKGRENIVAIKGIGPSVYGALSEKTNEVLMA